MARPWERLFATFSGFCVWFVSLVPLALVAVLLWALFALPPTVVFQPLGPPQLSQLLGPLIMTLLVGTLGATAAWALGVGAALCRHQLGNHPTGSILALALRVLESAPGVAVGWFIVVALALRPPISAVHLFVALCIVVSLSCAPRAAFLTRTLLTRIPASAFELAAATGAGARHTLAYLVLPWCTPRLGGIWLDALARGLCEATAVSLVIAVVTPQGRPHSLETLASTVMAIGGYPDPKIALCALLVLAAGAVVKHHAARKLDGIPWA
jgi:ABC-type phosphate transport system permease subunit